MPEQSIKEKMLAVNQEFYSIVQNPEFTGSKSEYYLQNFFPRVLQLTFECEQIGHVNLETNTRDDGSQYYSCDQCNKQIELNA
jgi:hypothetical protein